MQTAQELQREIDELIEIKKAFKITKAQKLRSYQNHKLGVTRHQEYIADSIDEFFDYMGSVVLGNLNQKNYKQGKTLAGVKKIINWSEIEKEGLKILQPAIHDAIIDGQKQVQERGVVKQKLHYPHPPRVDELGFAAQGQAEMQCSKLIKEVTAEQKLLVTNHIKEGIKEMHNIREISTRIGESVGLNSRLDGAVINYAKKLEHKGIPWSKAKHRVNKYKKKLHKYRSRMIARTESARGLTEGNLMGYKSMGIDYVEFVAAGNPCPVCDDMNGTVYTIARAKGVIPVHPHCTCVFVAAHKPKSKKGTWENMSAKDIDAEITRRTGIEVSLGRIPVRVRAQIARGICALNSKYDNILTKIKTISKSGGTYGQTRTYYNRLANEYFAEIEFNTQFFNHPEKYIESYKRTMKNGFHPKLKYTDDYELFRGTVDHEFGHALGTNWTNLNKELFNDVKKYSNKDFDKKVALHNKRWKGEITEAQYKKEIDSMRISKYAEKNPDETLAEAMVDYYHGADTKELSEKIIKSIDKYLKKGGN